jgi:hypothetical protein
MEARKQKAKNEIILKALSEFSDLEALRKEKRAIMDEEQRLKALLSLEKVSFCHLFYMRSRLRNMSVRFLSTPLTIVPLNAF